MSKLRTHIYQEHMRYIFRTFSSEETIKKITFIGANELSSRFRLIKTLCGAYRMREKTYKQTTKNFV